MVLELASWISLQLLAKIQADVRVNFKNKFRDLLSFYQTVLGDASI